MPSTVYIDPFAGNDNNTGGSYAEAWASWNRLRVELATSGNGVTRVRLDDQFARLEGTHQLLVASNADGVTIESVEEGRAITITTHKLLSGPYTQPDGATYPNVWETADSQDLTVLHQDRRYLNKVHAANRAAAVPLVNALPGSFWANASGVVFHPFGSTNPNADGSVYERTRELGNSGVNSLVEVTAQDVTLRDLILGGTTLAFQNQSGCPGNAYGLRIDHRDNYCQRVKTLGTNKHGIGSLTGEEGRLLQLDDCQVEQCSPYTGTGGQTCWNFFCQGAPTGLRAKIVRGRTDANTGLIGSTEGTNRLDMPTVYSHGENETIRFASIEIEDSAFPGAQNLSPGSAAEFNVTRSRFGSATVDVGTFDGCFVDHGSIGCFSSAGSIVTRNCVIRSVMSYGESNPSSGYLTQGTIVGAGCTYDGRFNEYAFSWGPFSRVGATNLTLRNFVWITDPAKGQALLNRFRTTDTIDAQYGRCKLGNTPFMMNEYPADGTPAYPTLAQAQALGLFANTTNHADLNLDEDYRPAADSPCRNVNTLGFSHDRSGREFLTRDDAGAFEYVPPTHRIGRMLLRGVA